MKVRIYTKEQTEFFPLYADTIDIKHPQEKVVRKDGFVSHQIFLVNKGNGVIHTGGKSYTLKENDMFYLGKDVPHEYYGYDDNFQTTYLSFFGSGFDNIKKYYNLGDFEIYKNKNKGLFKSSVKNLFEVLDITHELSKLCALTFSVVIDFFDEVYKKEATPIEDVYNYIEENYSNPITLDDILSVYPFSKTKLCHDFKEKYQITVFEMLTIIRLRHARYMVKNNPHIKLKTIALSCGFNDVSYFGKMYKKVFGATPKND